MRTPRILSLLSAFALGSAALAEVTINEIRIDQPGSDDDEYFELAGAAGDLLDGLTYLVIGDGVTADGTIEAVIDLTALSIPADGYLFGAEDGDTFGAGADFTGNLNFENSDNVTHMLVEAFTGADGDDLDTDDDGVLDVMPWTSVLDSVALVETLDVNDPGFDWYYSSNIVGPDGPFVPGHVYRLPNGDGPWNIGPFDPAGGLDTPGVANVPEPATIGLLSLGALALVRRRR